MLTASLNTKWPNQPLKVTCHLTAEVLLYAFLCETFPGSFDNINQTEHTTINIRLFYYNTSYLLNAYVIVSQ